MRTVFNLHQRALRYRTPKFTSEESDDHIGEEDDNQSYYCVDDRLATLSDILLISSSHYDPEATNDKEYNSEESQKTKNEVQSCFCCSADIPA